LSNILFPITKSKEIDKYIFKEKHFNMHDPLKVFKNHRERVAIGWPYSHKESPKEEHRKKSFKSRPNHGRKKAIEVGQAVRVPSNATLDNVILWQ
jgi:hypothetical protein